MIAPENLRAIEEVLPVGLEPAFRFDPRLPGKFYAPQANVLRLHAAAIRPIPTSPADIAFASVKEQVHWIRTGQIKSAALTQIYLDRIEQSDGELKSFITVTRDLALAQAIACDQALADGRVVGPLHGIPYTLKDVFDTAGISTTYGSALFRDRIPTADAIVVTVLREAGAVLLGKVATGELAWGANWFGGEVRNPWNLDEASGGSSAGSAAAVAAGLCSFSLGTDSLGSILNPADRCGIVGLRATFGRVPVTGSMPVAPSLARIGPLCRGVEDAAIVLSAVNAPGGVGFEYDSDIGVEALKIGYAPAWFERIGFGSGGSPVSAGHVAGLDAVRDQLVEINLPPLPYTALTSILYVESAAIFDRLINSGDAEKTPWAGRWRNARLLSAVDYVQIERFRMHVMQMMDAIFDRVDMLICPAYGSFALLVITNCTGHPGLTFRTGFMQSPARALDYSLSVPTTPAKRIPANLTLHGRLFEEGKMIALARHLEAQLKVWRDQPAAGQS